MHSLAEQAGIGDGLWIKLALDHAMRSIPVYLSLDIAVQQFAVTIDIRQAELDVSFRSFNIFGDNAYDFVQLFGVFIVNSCIIVVIAGFCMLLRNVLLHLHFSGIWEKRKGQRFDKGITSPTWVTSLP